MRHVKWFSTFCATPLVLSLFLGCSSGGGAGNNALLDSGQPMPGGNPAPAGGVAREPGMGPGAMEPKLDDGLLDSGGPSGGGPGNQNR